LPAVEPRFVNCDPAADPLSVVVSLNVKRRNLNAAQRAMAAADAWLRAEAEGKVQTKGGDRGNQHTGGKEAKAQSALLADPRSHFGKLFGVGEKYVAMARDLLLDDPVGVQAVCGGTKDLRAAHLALENRVGLEKTGTGEVRIGWRQPFR
jgi:hypothetical protein